MKKTSVLILNFLLACALPVASLSFAKTPGRNLSKETISYSQELGVQEPKILPGSFQYFFLEFWRNISAFLAFDSGKRAEQLFSRANSRLYELRKLSEKKSFSSKIPENALKEYLKDIEAGKIALEQLKDEKTKNERIKKYSSGEFARQRIFEDLKNYYSQELIEKYQKKSMESYVKLVFSRGAEKTKELFREYIDANIEFTPGGLRDVGFIDTLKNEAQDSRLKESLGDAKEYALRKIQENLSAPEAENFFQKLRESLGTASTSTPYTFREILEEIIKEKKILEEGLKRNQKN